VGATITVVTPVSRANRAGSFFLERNVCRPAAGDCQPANIQALLRHSWLATTTDVYMQEIPESVKVTAEAISKELRLKSETAEAS
jgi:hypothetical protein